MRMWDAFSDLYHCGYCSTFFMLFVSTLAYFYYFFIRKNECEVVHLSRVITVTSVNTFVNHSVMKDNHQP